jgi:uncharacterized protein YbaA (DUF1428 family)
MKGSYVDGFLLVVPKGKQPSIKKWLSGGRNFG